MGSSVRHAEALLPAIAEVLEAAYLRPDDLEGVVVGAGPGSFTGVRVAAATARGLARSLEIPLFAYGSLLALAAAAGRTDRAVCALMDARRGEVYAACYANGGGAYRTLLEPLAAPLPEVLAAVAPHRPVFAGSTVPGLPDGTERAVGAMSPAAALIRLGAQDPEGGLVPVPARWEPAYLRPPGAVRVIW